MLQKIKLLFFLFLFSLIHSNSAQAICHGATSPLWDWKTVETPHFRIHFHAPIYPIALDVANYLEDMHRYLVPFMKWEPRTKTSVTLAHNTDFANGQAAAAFRCGMLIYLTPPENWISLAHYQDWLRGLLIHEYIHILNLDVTRSFWEVIRYIYGDVIRPNSLLHSWILEGQAVYAETRFTQAGRGRSSYFEMLLRTAVDEGVLDSPEFITLNRLDLEYPYHPGGSSVYQFGYFLFNQLIRDKKNRTRTQTHDGDDTVKDAEELMGILSYRSGGRVPYFINDNVKHVTGKDWYEYWEDFVKETRTRMKSQIERIKRQPVTQTEKLTQKGFFLRGPRVSPNGKWIAYTHDHSDRPTGLYLWDIQRKKAERLSDKLMGATHSFTPDSRFILHSSLNRKSKYYFWSDLYVYDLKEKREYALTDGARVRNPDVSQDGKWVVFSQNKVDGTRIIVAPLEQTEKKLSLGPWKILYETKNFTRLTQPKFSPSGKTIVFTEHVNGKVGETLKSVDVRSRRVLTLVADGALNRFPTYDSKGNLYFVSDATGVDNLYRFSGKRDPIQVTNTKTGIWFPTFSKDGDLYGAVFSSKGFDLSQIQLSSRSYSTERASVPPPPAPPVHESANLKRIEKKNYPMKDYSIFPSIWPRAWAPSFVFFGTGKWLLGGSVLGFDDSERHSYSAALAMDNFSLLPNWSLNYTNRSFGPDITLSAGDSLSLVSSSREFARTWLAGTSVSYSFDWTYSSLTPSIGYALSRTRFFDRNISRSDPVEKGRYNPRVDVKLIYKKTRSSRLSLGTEEGRISQLAYRYTQDSGKNFFKGLVKNIEFFRITEHSVLSTALSLSWVNRFESSSLNNVLVTGRFPSLFGPFSSFSNQDLTALYVRGYPSTIFFTRSAALLSLEYRFPLLRFYHGWGTFPVFLKNLYGFVFGESAFLPVFEKGGVLLPSTGGGIRFSSKVFLHVPLTLSLEYHQGLNSRSFGRGEVVGGLQSSIPAF